MAIEQLGWLSNRLNALLNREKKAGKSASSAKMAKGRKFSSIVNDEIVRKEQEFSLSNNSSVVSSDKLEGLLDNVHQMGDALLKDPVFGPLRLYRKAVKGFITYVVEHGLQSEEQMGVLNTSNMQRKKYRVIRVTDEKLESLAAYIIRGQQQQMEILARINEINGMLVNLLR